MANWQKSTDVITRKYFEGQARFEIVKWLSEVENTVRPMIKEDKGGGKHIYLAPLDDGCILEANMTESYTVLTEYDKNMNKKEILSAKSSERGETAPVRAYVAQLKKEKRGLGYPFPEALMNMFKALRVNEMFTFENGTTFLCTEKNRNIVTMKKLCGSLIDGADVTDLLEDGKAFDVDPDSKDMQALYRLIYDRLTDSAKGRIFSYPLVKDYVLNLKRSAANNSDKRIDLGPMEIHLKKPFMSAAKWMNTEKETLSDDQVINIYAWMNNAPVITTFIHETSDKNTYDDTCFFEHIEQFYKEGKFENVYKSICEYVLKLSGELKVEIKTYIKNNDDFFADGFLFTFEKGGVMMRRATFENNDIKKRIVTLKKSQFRIFSEFCAQKYNSDYFLMKNNKRAVLRKMLPKSEYIVE